jgi:hypothetical protein
MQNAPGFTSITCLFFACLSYSQDIMAVYPKDFLGVYDGRLQIYNHQGEMQEIPKEFSLEKTDSLNRFDYLLVL